MKNKKLIDTILREIVLGLREKQAHNRETIKKFNELLEISEDQDKLKDLNNLLSDMEKDISKQTSKARKKCEKALKELPSEKLRNRFICLVESIFAKEK